MATETALVAPPPMPGVVTAQTSGFRLRPSLSWLWPYLFLLPFVIVFVAFFVAPFVYDVIQSFYAERHAGGLGLTPPKVVWVGLENYTQALHDPGFWTGFQRVIIFGIVQI